MHMAEKSPNIEKEFVLWAKVQQKVNIYFRHLLCCLAIWDFKSQIEVNKIVPASKKMYVEVFYELERSQKLKLLILLKQF